MSSSSSTSTARSAPQPISSSIASGAAFKMEKFLSKPTLFSGEETSGIHPKAWLKSVERIKKGLIFSDDELLLVASSYLVGPAGLWWESVEDSVQNVPKYTDSNFVSLPF